MAPVTLVSFGFKVGVVAADQVFDCRGLINPHRYAPLRHLDGRSSEVREFLGKTEYFHTLVAKVVGAGAPGRTIACGCLGGRHRSVAVVEEAAKRIRAQGREVIVTHREL